MSKDKHDKNIPIQDHHLMDQACKAIAAMKKNDALRIYDSIAWKIKHDKWHNDK